MHPFLAHMIGDFLIQNEWMASHKKNNSWVAFVHVVAYLLPFLLTGLLWWQIVLIGLTHFLQDRSSFVDWFVRTWKRIPSGEGGIIPLIVDQVFHLIMIQIAIWLGMIL
jgi:hypothetical protein